VSDAISVPQDQTRLNLTQRLSCPLSPTEEFLKLWKTFPTPMAMTFPTAAHDHGKTVNEYATALGVPETVMSRYLQDRCAEVITNMGSASDATGGMPRGMAPFCARRVAALGVLMVRLYCGSIGVDHRGRRLP
jgi:hypothetical protein